MQCYRNLFYRNSHSLKFCKTTTKCFGSSSISGCQSQPIKTAFTLWLSKHTPIDWILQYWHLYSIIFLDSNVQMCCLIYVSTACHIDFITQSKQKISKTYKVLFLSLSLSLILEAKNDIYTHGQNTRKFVT